MKAVFSSKAGHTLGDHPIPSPAANEVQIHNVFVAANPKDWKLVEMIPGYETVEGNDCAGYVTAIGSGVSKFKVGDTFTTIKAGSQYGTNAEYSPEVSTFHLGPKTSLSDACTVPLAGMTSAIALFVHLKIPMPPSSSPGGLIINGASSSVGAYATQLAKKSGLKVLGTAGAGASYATSLGADVIIDYRGKTSATLAAELNAAATKLFGSDAPWYVYDGVSTKESIEMLASVLQPRGGRVATVWAPANDAPANVVVDNVKVSTAHTVDREFAEGMFAKFGEWLESGELNANNVKVIPGGLAGVEAGMGLLKDGKIASEKLVYCIADTPGVAK
ncbi:hypothetical protein RQP46_003344 [Phenoliferia psychrophenolica]